VEDETAVEVVPTVLTLQADNGEVHADGHQGLGAGSPTCQLRVLGVALCVWAGGLRKEGGRARVEVMECVSSEDRGRNGGGP
jgi:hypothetical protein